MNVRVYKKLYKALLSREHIKRLPETVFVEVRDYVITYVEKNGKLTTLHRLLSAKKTYANWLVKYYNERTRKPAEETLASMQQLGILFFYVWYVQSQNDYKDDFLIEESVKLFNLNREYRRTFKLPKPPKRRGRPPLDRSADLVSRPRTRSAAKGTARRNLRETVSVDSGPWRAPQKSSKNRPAGKTVGRPSIRKAVLRKVARRSTVRKGRY